MHSNCVTDSLQVRGEENSFCNYFQLSTFKVNFLTFFRLRGRQTPKNWSNFFLSFSGRKCHWDFCFYFFFCNKSGQPSHNCFLTRKPPGVKRQTKRKKERKKERKKDVVIFRTVDAWEFLTHFLFLNLTQKW